MKYSEAKTMVMTAEKFTDWHEERHMRVCGISKAQLAKLVSEGCLQTRVMQSMMHGGSWTEYRRA